MEQRRMGKVLIAYSGGIDSTVLLHELLERGLVVEALTVDYGQPARPELALAGEMCRRLGVEQHHLSVPNLHTLLSPGSEPPLGRRLVVLSLAAATAARHNCDTIAFGERVDRNIPDWVPAFAHLLDVGHKGQIAVHAPFIERTKDQIIRLCPRRLPLRRTWSCYRGGVMHCGTCRGCIQRQRGFRLAGVPDPTVYEQTEPPILSFEAVYLAGPSRDLAS